MVWVQIRNFKKLHTHTHTYFEKDLEKKNVSMAGEGGGNIWNLVSECQSSNSSSTLTSQVILGEMINSFKTHFPHL